MYKRGLLMVAAAFALTGCDGTVCPAIAIPIYNITVYDDDTGELLCQQHWGGEDHDCDITVTYSSDDNSSADISVTADGYISSTQEDVANNSAKYRCFDQPSYTTDVVFYLEQE